MHTIGRFRDHTTTIVRQPTIYWRDVLDCKKPYNHPDILGMFHMALLTGYNLFIWHGHVYRIEPGNTYKDTGLTTENVR